MNYKCVCVCCSDYSGYGGYDGGYGNGGGRSGGPRGGGKGIKHQTVSLNLHFMPKVKYENKIPPPLQKKCIKNNAKIIYNQIQKKKTRFLFE